LLKQKFKALSSFQQFKYMAELYFNKPLKAIQID